jgi:hypothetical protein
MRMIPLWTAAKAFEKVLETSGGEVGAGVAVGAVVGPAVGIVLVSAGTPVHAPTTSEMTRRPRPVR